MPTDTANCPTCDLMRRGFEVFCADHPDEAKRIAGRQPAPPAPDEDERAFWCAAFCAALPGWQGDTTPAEAASGAAILAEAALAEYRKRWGRS